MSKLRESPHEGYFMAIDTDDKGNYINNVVGRFTDHKVVDTAATEAADGVKQFKTITICLTRAIMTAIGELSNDESVERVTDKNRSRLAARFPEAWAAYCKNHKTTNGVGNGKRRGRPPKVRTGEDTVNGSADDE